MYAYEMKATLRDFHRNTLLPSRALQSTMNGEIETARSIAMSQESAYQDNFTILQYSHYIHQTELPKMKIDTDTATYFTFTSLC